LERKRLKKELIEKKRRRERKNDARKDQKQRKEKEKNLHNGTIPFSIVLNIGSPINFFYSLLKKKETTNLESSIC
jgi:hypothetical protein